MNKRCKNALLIASSELLFSFATWVGTYLLFRTLGQPYAHIVILEYPGAYSAYPTNHIDFFLLEKEINEKSPSPGKSFIGCRGYSPKKDEDSFYRIFYLLERVELFLRGKQIYGTASVHSDKKTQDAPVEA